MKYGNVPGIEKKTTRIVLGTMIVTTEEEERSFRLLDDAVELGVTSIDTAHGYAGGNSERCLGKWMEARGNREQMVILTKGCHPNGDRKRVTVYDIGADLHDSLARLRTDYIDIWLLHRDDPSVPVGPIVETLNRHMDEGKIRCFGGSNWTHERIAEANEYAEKNGLVPFGASSPNFGLAEQVENPWGEGCVGVSGPANEDARAWYAKTDTPVFAYSSLGRGLFSGRVTRENFEEAADNACKTAYCHEVNFERLDRAKNLASEKGVSVAQIAMAYILNQPLNVFACVGAADREEIAANVAAADIDLTPEECAWLDLRADSR